ncbi:hypothetical protein SKAU_G00072320 [Synaphobranchus kaupii]|uniref:Uncharacterized protein n=1 Tax=Synaphobranchus kaupii TaxID=118154 RepID=A0A9Q1JBV2_SYNKA|nr:hypothetical protein SKAU_G00072320 [Synaphobranchus kaupii]
MRADLDPRALGEAGPFCKAPPSAPLHRGGTRFLFLPWPGVSSFHHLNGFALPSEVCFRTRCTFLHPAELRTVHTSLLVLPDSLTHASLLPFREGQGAERRKLKLRLHRISAPLIAPSWDVSAFLGTQARGLAAAPARSHRQGRK